MMAQLATEVQRFRDWAETYPHHHGEWEWEYPHWDALYDSADRLIDSSSGGAIESSAVPDLLYVLARDNEAEHVCDAVAKNPELLRTLARLAVGCNEPHAKWQLAVAVGESQLPDAADLLRPFLTDPDEYVRRRSLMSYAPFAPADAEAIAVHSLDDPFEYTRMAALNVLYQLQSPHLPNALERLGADSNEYVRSYVDELRAFKTGG